MVPRCVGVAAGEVTHRDTLAVVDTLADRVPMALDSPGKACQALTDTLADRVAVVHSPSDSVAALDSPADKAVVVHSLAGWADNRDYKLPAAVVARRVDRNFALVAPNVRYKSKVLRQSNV